MHVCEFVFFGAKHLEIERSFSAIHALYFLLVCGGNYMGT